MLTSRDYAIVDFLGEFKVADTDMICSQFFSDKRTCQQRLKCLTEANKIKRIRDGINNNFIYFVKQPRQLKHSLLVTQFFCEVSKTAKVDKFKIEPKYGSVRPDAVFVYSTDGVMKRLGFLEVEISNKGFDKWKYELFLKNDNYKQYLSVKPTVYIVTDKLNKLDASFQHKIIDLKFNNMNLM